MKSIRLVAILQALGVLSGCIFKIDVDGGDSGVDASVPDAGCLLGDVPTSLPYAFTGDVSVTVPGCATSAVVWAPDGALVEAGVNPVQGDGATVIGFRATIPGLYRLSIGPDDASTEIEVVAPLAEDAGYLVHYPDRIDTCTNDLRWSDEGRLYCKRDVYGTTVWVYDTDGSLMTTLPSWWVLVKGNSVWSYSVGETANVLEHRTDTPSGPVLDDSLMLNPLVSQSGRYEFGEVRADRFVRAIDGLVQVVDWDGARLSLRDLPNHSSTQAFMVEGDDVWNRALCEESPGCQNTSCPDVVTCPFEPGSALAVDEASAWVYLRDTNAIALWSRPLATHSVIAQPRRLEALGAASELLSERYLAAIVESPEWLFTPVRDTHSFHFVVAPKGALITDKWIVTVVDPFTLRVTPK
jgi:hypothetical protein